jgi:MOB kinase activator 1
MCKVYLVRGLAFCVLSSETVKCFSFQQIKRDACLQGLPLKKHIDATLGSGNLREAVRLPIGEDLNEWLAVNSKLPSQLVPISS